MPSGTSFLSLALSLVIGCASAAREPTTHAPRAPDPTRDFQSALDREHRLVGRIWERAGARFITAAELIERVAAARNLVLGERHDNPDHHRLQAHVLEQLAARGRKPALVFEMLDGSAGPAVERARAQSPHDPDAIARAVDWEHSGWPPWPLYRPLFALALQGGWPIVAAGLPREQAMQLARAGSSALDSQLAQRFALDQPAPPELQAALRAEMRDAHCGLLPDTMLDAMALIQRVRDALLAQAMHTAGTGADGAVAIAGNGHARSDRGVPAALRTAFGAGAITIGMQEVRAEWTEVDAYAAAYGASQLPFDYVWFTPRAGDDDPCAGLRKAHATPHPDG